MRSYSIHADRLPTYSSKQGEDENDPVESTVVRTRDCVPKHVGNDSLSVGDETCTLAEVCKDETRVYPQTERKLYRKSVELSKTISVGGGKNGQLFRMRKIRVQA